MGYPVLFWFSGWGCPGDAVFECPVAPSGKRRDYPGFEINRLEYSGLAVTFGARPEGWDPVVQLQNLKLDRGVAAGTHRYRYDRSLHGVVGSRTRYPRCIRGRTRISDRDSLRAMTIGIIVEVLQRVYVYPVFWDERPWSREPHVEESWDGDVWATVRRIEQIWWERRLDDDFPDIVWFGPTVTGRHRNDRTSA